MWELNGIKYALAISKDENKKYFWKKTFFYTLNFHETVQNHMFDLYIQEALSSTSSQRFLYPQKIEKNGQKKKSPKYFAQAIFER